MKKYKTFSDGIGVIYYEDETCTINVGVADFRDSCWWIGGGMVYNKITQDYYKLNNNQKLFLYRRIAYDCHQQEVYNEKFGFIKSDEYNPLTEDKLNLLEVE